MSRHDLIKDSLIGQIVCICCDFRLGLAVLIHESAQTELIDVPVNGRDNTRIAKPGILWNL